MSSNQAVAMAAIFIRQFPYRKTYREKRVKVAREIEHRQGELEKVIEAVLAELEPSVFGRERSKSCSSP